MVPHSFEGGLSLTLTRDLKRVFWIGLKFKSEFPEEEGDQILKLMFARKKRGYDEGEAEGYDKAKKDVIHKLLSKGFDPENSRCTGVAC